MTGAWGERAGFDFDAVDFVTSDHHFGHARVSELASRPFSSVEEMNEAMIERWNALVRPDDVVLHLGDLALGPIEQSVALTARLNGRRLLVPGTTTVSRPRRRRDERSRGFVRCMRMLDGRCSARFSRVRATAPAYSLPTIRMRAMRRE